MGTREPLTVPGREGAPPKQRRVYKAVAVSDGGDGGFAVLLDGKTAMTPMRARLAAPVRALAQAVADEWAAQDPYIDPQAMPLTRLLATAVDRVGPQRDAVIASLLSYVDADVICYRAAHPADLRARQQGAWQPVADWLLRAHDIRLAAVESLMPAAQPQETAARFRSVLECLDDDALTAFQAAAALTSSLALSLALTHRRLSAAEVFAAAFLDELYQAEKWGDDPAARTRRGHIAADLAAIERYLTLAA